MTAAPLSTPGRAERLAIVYVLREHVNGRVVNETPLENAAARDLDEIYAIDRLVNYPVVRDNYESRVLAEGMRKRENHAWAEAAIDAIYRGAPIPGKPRLQWERVLTELVKAGPVGATRKEICRAYGLDGGRISAALTLLHECGVIVSLPGEKR